MSKSNPIIEAVDYLNFKYDFRSNTITLDYEISLKGKNSYSIANEDSLFIELQQEHIKTSVSNVVSILKGGLICTPYDPIRSYFEHLPKWDETMDYILNLASFVKPIDRKAFDLHFKKHLVRTVKCAFDEHFYNKHALIIRKDKQNDGKTEFMRFLCPPDLENYIAENIGTDKDSHILLTKNVLINLDELDSISKAESNSLKALFSKDKINVRLPYDRKASVIHRRASFIGSTNRGEFLNDETGSVRWLVFDITEIDFDYNNKVTGVKKVDINQVWAQAYHLYKNNFACSLTRDEIAENEKRNRNYQILSIEVELIQKFFKPDPNQSEINFMTVAEIVISLKCIVEGIRINEVQVGKALSFLGFERKPKYIEGYGQPRYGFFLIKTLNEPTQVTSTSQSLTESCPY